jgi:hypothetical protein
VRGYDGLQLATALAVQMRMNDPAALVFVSADGKLNDAARAERLATADPTV